MRGVDRSQNAPTTTISIIGSRGTAIPLLATTTISWPNYHSGRNGDFQRILRFSAILDVLSAVAGVAMTLGASNDPIVVTLLGIAFVIPYASKGYAFASLVPPNAA